MLESRLPIDDDGERRRTLTNWRGDEEALAVGGHAPLPLDAGHAKELGGRANRRAVHGDGHHGSTGLIKQFPPVLPPARRHAAAARDEHL